MITGLPDPDLFHKEAANSQSKLGLCSMLGMVRLHPAHFQAEFVGILQSTRRAVRHCVDTRTHTNTLVHARLQPRGVNEAVIARTVCASHTLHGKAGRNRQDTDSHLIPFAPLPKLSSVW